MRTMFFAFFSLFWAFLLNTNTLLAAPLAEVKPASWSQAAPLSSDLIVPLQNIEQIALGGNHTCALTTSGGVKCWGYAGSGQLGDNGTADKSTPVDVDGLKDVKWIAAGVYHTCALLNSGGVKCWGYNYHSQLGDGSTTSKSAPVNVDGLSGVTRIAAGSYHTCALLATDGVKCWGYNVLGQLGDGTTDNDKSIPVDVIGLGGRVKAIAAGLYHTCALLTTGNVQCWGGNSAGQLGDGTLVNKSTPVDVSGLGAEVIAIASGETHTCALTIGGGIKCWGSNGGKLGNGTAVDKSTPVDVSGLSSGVQTITTGRFHTCALLATGSIWCWGVNLFGALGDGTTGNKSTPVNISSLNSGVKAIGAGGFHTCALMTNGSVQCWGYNDHGQLGNGTLGNKGSPSAVSGLSSGVKAIATGVNHTCALILDGVKCWGYNGAGQLGNSGGITPGDVTNLRSGATAVAAGGSHTCALTTTGGVRCWGSNAYGQLGDNTIVNKSSPVNVVGLSNGVKQLATGESHTCALTTSLGVQCWGRNNHGQLGNGTFIDQSSPVTISALSAQITMLTAGTAHTCALTTNATVQCWGNNDHGQLGDGTTQTQTLPVNVVGLNADVIAIAAGASHTCALMANHTAKCWGDNQYGQLGDGTTTSEHTPVDVVPLPSDFAQIDQLVAGSNHTCGINSAGSIRCWGFNGSGQLGDTTTADKATPADRVDINSAVTLLAAGGEHTCAVTIIGSLKCWGSDAYGQLGDGMALHVTPVDVVITQPPPQCYNLVYMHVGNGAALTATPSNSAGCFAGRFVAGATIVLHANPAANWRVAGWQGTVDDTNVSTDNRMTMPANDATVNVTYAAVQPPIQGGVDQGDVDEDDNTCAQAKTLADDGVAQTHSFHQAGDKDWVRFEAAANVPYRIHITVPDTSTADVNLKIRRQCDDATGEAVNPSFSPGILTTITRAVTSTVYLQLSNVITTSAGPNVVYQVEVHPVPKSQGQHALILAAGSFTTPDSLQPNIDKVVTGVYQFYRDSGYTDDDIFFLTSQPSLFGRDATATLANLQAAITDWAKNRAISDHSLTLYLMDHGDPGKFYLDRATEQVLTPALLNTWLDDLQRAQPDLKITIVIEACYSGSFIIGDTITHANSISAGKLNRLVIASTSPQSLALASTTGAYFSDFYLTALRQGDTIPESFSAAYGALHELFGRNPALENRQEPQIDANSNGVPNQPEDITLSTQFHNPDTSPQTPNQAPFLASVTLPAAITDQHGLLQAVVHDDSRVQRVWAVITPPSYHTPTSSSELVPEARPQIDFVEQSKSSSPTDYVATYVANYAGFDEIGLYQIAVYAMDDKGLVSNPKVFEVRAGSQLFLPLVNR